MREGVTLGRRKKAGISRASLATAAMLTGITLLGATGCDTVAQIAFPERRFQEIRPIGVVSPGGPDQCGGVGSQGTLRMVLVANDRTPIKPGEDLSLTTMDLRASDIQLSEGRLFSYPDTECQSGDCDTGYTCSPPPTGVEELGNRCQNTTALGVSETPRFVGNESPKQALAVVMSNEGRWRGWLPEDVARLIPADSDGFATGTADITLNNGRAGDRTGNRFGSLTQMAQTWNDLNSRIIIPNNREAFFGLWTFAETAAETTSHVGAISPDGTPWTRQGVRASAAVLDAQNTQPSQTRADVYGSLIRIMNQGFRDQQLMSDVTDRHIVLIVGGHDDRPDGQNVQDAIEIARELNIMVSVVQVDPPMEKDLLRDDFRYYEWGGNSPCSADADCKNFEGCRQPQFFCNADNPSSCTSVAYPSDTSVNYCLPRRDENGRVGPIQDFEQLACQTGGSYSYVPVVTNELLYSRLAGLTLWQEAGWEGDVDINEAGSMIPGQPYSLSGSLQITQGQTQTYNFSQAGSVQGSPGVESSRDTRPVFFRQ